MQQHDSNTFLWWPSRLNATNYIDIRDQILPLHCCYSNVGASEKSHGSCLLLLS